MLKDLGTDDPESVGTYRLLGRLGAGGMGQVYLARSQGGRLVAIKVIRPEVAEDPEFRTRFAHEVAAARNVSAMFTAAVVDADPEAETPWMATVYVPGPSLNEAITAEGPLPAPTVLALAAGLAEGLQAIHAAGLVHRDLKPSNVLLAHDGPRVIDFGISRAVERSILTQTGMVMGSPGFLSPEQAMGHVVGPPSDVFSLGAVLTFAATGNGPFGDGPTPTLMYRVVHQPPDLSRVPDELRPLLESCLAKEPEDRPTPGQLLEVTDAATLSEGEWLPEQMTATLAKYAPAAVSPRTLSAQFPSGPATPLRSGSSPVSWPATPPPSAPRPVPSAPRPVPSASRPAAAAPETASAGTVAAGTATTDTGSAGTVAAGAATAGTGSAGTVSGGTLPAGTVTAGTAPAQTVSGTGATPAEPGPSPRRGRGRRLRRTAYAVLVVLVLLIGGGLYGGWQYAQGQYYVGVQDGNVTIFRGVDQNIAGISLSSVVTRTNLPAAQLTASSQATLSHTITAGSLTAARSVVGQLQSTVGACRAQWTALAKWQAADARYRAADARYRAADAKYRAAVAADRRKKTKPKIKAPRPPAKPGARPATPKAGSCAPASAFGIK